MICIACILLLDAYATPAFAHNLHLAPSSLHKHALVLEIVGVTNLPADAPSVSRVTRHEQLALHLRRQIVLLFMTPM
jgi:hypothetical protein